MIRKLIIILYVLSLTQFGCYTNEDNDVNDHNIVNIEDNHPYKSSKILASASSLEEAQIIAREKGLRIVTTYHAISSVLNRWYGVFEKTTSNKRFSISVMSDMKKQRREFIAEPDYRASTHAVPNDPKLSRLWGMNDSNDTDIDAVEAWDINTGSPQVIVGVIDSGLNYNHPDLAANAWVNPDEIPGNGIDDDNNGYIDDIHGINSITNSGDPDDDHSHGSHVSGIIGAVGNNEIGVTGVAWNVKIMGLKFLNRSATGDTSDAVKCIDYAIDQKLKGQNIVALNNSWGDLPFTHTLTDAIKACSKVGIIFITAAGNGGSDSRGDDNDARPVYPASFDFPNVVAVAATTDNDTLCKFSNYGATSVDLGAPGIGIYSTKLKNTYGTKNGTSMAAPHVAGAIALIASEFPNESMSTRINRILNNVDPIPSLSGKLVTGGRLNVYKALTSNGTTPSPRLVADFTYKIDPNNLTVTLTDRSTSNASDIISWNWNFGDGNSSSLQDVTHKYSSAETYTVTLTVKNNKNQTNSLSRQVTISGGGGDNGGDDDDDDNDDDNGSGCN